MLSSVDYLLDTVPALKNWRYDSAIAVLDVLEQEIQGWSKRKEQMFPRNLLNNALEYIRYNANYKIYHVLPHNNRTIGADNRESSTIQMLDFDQFLSEVRYCHQLQKDSCRAGL